MAEHSDVVTDEVHDAAADEDTGADFVAEASFKVVVFKALGRPTVGMAKGYLLFSIVLA